MATLSSWLSAWRSGSVMALLVIGCGQGAAPVVRPPGAVRADEEEGPAEEVGELSIGEAVSGRLTPGGQTWRGIPAAVYTFEGEGETRIVGEIRSGAGFVPQLAIEHEGIIIASSKRYAEEFVSRLDVLLPVDGAYTVAAHAQGAPLEGDFVLLSSHGTTKKRPSRRI